MQIGRLIIADVSRKKNKATKLMYDLRNKKIFQIANKLVWELNEQVPYQSNMYDNKLYKKIIGKLDENGKSTEKSIKIKNRTLNLVRILVTNHCNLACRYCYANEGSYGMKQENMSRETYEVACEYLSKQFDEIREINFFGGEPCLNLPAIQYICEYFSQTFGDVHSQKIPKFSIVSNGTIINEELIEIINKFNFWGVVISLDSTDPNINDTNRIYKYGKGSFNTVDLNIKKLKKYTDTIITIESTYTNEHKIHNKTYAEIMKGNYREYGTHLNIIAEELASKYGIKKADSSNFDYNNFKENLKLFIEDGLVSHDIMSFLSSIYSNAWSRSFCDAAIGQIAIAPNGDIYPCQMFIAKSLNAENSKFCMGNVFKSYKLKEDVLKWFTINNSKSKSECRECYIRGICNNCIFQEMTYNSNFSGKLTIDCERKKSNYYDKIQTLLNLISDEEYESKLRSHISEISEYYRV